MCWWQQFSNLMRSKARAAAAGKRPGGIWGEEGSSLVEFAFVTVIFLSLLFGIFDFSLAFYTYHYVSDAAREGSRYALVRGSKCSTYSNTTPCPAQESDIATYVQGLNYPGIDPSHLTVTVKTLQYSTSTRTFSACPSAGTACNDTGDQVQVKVLYAFPLRIPFWKDTSVDITSTSTMVYSQ